VRINFLSIILTLAWAAAAQGQASPPESEKPEQAQQTEQQTGSPADKSALGVHYEYVVVTATRTETSLVDLPVSVQLVKGLEIEQKQYNNPNLGEIVRDLPGVSVGHGNRTTPPWIHLRGTGYFIGRTLYMVDEQPLAEPMMSIAVHPDNVSAAEVLLGPSSSLYGPNASGGAVNVRSASGRDRDAMELGAGYGTFNSWRPRLSFGRAFGNWDWISSYNLDKSDGYQNMPLESGLYLLANGRSSWLNSVNIENQSYTNHYGYQRVGYRSPASGRGFTAGVHVFNMDIYDGRPNAYTDSTRVIATGAFFNPLGGLGMLTARFGYQSRRQDSQSTRGVVKVANAAIAGRFVFAPADANNSWVYDPTVTQRPHTTYTRLPLDFQMDVKMLRGHKITAGYNYMIDQSRSFTFNPDRTQTLAQTKYGINQSAVYLQDQYQFLNEKATLIVGIRRDWWKYHDVYDTGSTNRTPPDVDKAATTYRGGLKFRVTDQFGLRASVGTAFWPGNATWFFQNLSTGNTWREANPGLKPESTYMGDAGVDFFSRSGKTQASATLYVGRITDAISYVYAQHPTLPGVQIVRTSNSDEVSIKGLELALRRQILPNWSGYANYTLNRSRITVSATNKGHQLRNSPDNLANFGLQYADNRRRQGASFYARYSDTRYYDDENTPLKYYFMREYLTLGIKLYKTIPVGGREVTFSVGVDNLTNSKYDAEFINQAPGRFIEAGVTYRFGF